MKGPVTTFSDFGSFVLTAWLLAPTAALYQRPAGTDEIPRLVRRFPPAKTQGSQTDLETPPFLERLVQHPEPDLIGELYGRLAGLCRIQLDGSQPESLVSAEIQKLRAELARLQHEEAARVRQSAEAARPFTREQVQRVLADLRAVTRRDENPSGSSAAAPETRARS